MNITKCTGEGCPVKEKCFRFTTKDEDIYFDTPPYTNDPVFLCDYFWGDKLTLNLKPFNDKDNSPEAG